jgi:hypothetical protein
VAIDANGHAGYTNPLGAIGRLIVDYYFSRDGTGVAHVKGTYDISGRNVGYDSVAQVNCTVNFSGRRG